MLWRSSILVSPLEYADTKKGPASPLESAVTKLLDLKSLRMNRYSKTVGAGVNCPCGRRSLLKGNGPIASAGATRFN